MKTKAASAISSSKAALDLIRRLLDEPINVKRPGGKRKRMTNREAILQILIKQAVSHGHQGAFKLLLDLQGRYPPLAAELKRVTQASRRGRSLGGAVMYPWDMPQEEVDALARRLSEERRG